MNRLLDYNPLPSKKIQNKINYYMTPYNSSVVHEKFIDFKYNEEQSNSNFHWCQITDFILKNDVDVLDHTLNSVNDNLHRIFENKMRDEPAV